MNRWYVSIQFFLHKLPNIMQIATFFLVINLLGESFWYFWSVVVGLITPFYLANELPSYIKQHKIKCTFDEMLLPLGIYCILFFLLYIQLLIDIST